MSQEAELNTIFDKIKDGSPEKKDPALEGLEAALNEMQLDGDKKLALNSSVEIVAKKL